MYVYLIGVLPACITTTRSVTLPVPVLYAVNQGSS